MVLVWKNLTLKLNNFQNSNTKKMAASRSPFLSYSDDEDLVSVEHILSISKCSIFLDTFAEIV